MPTVNLQLKQAGTEVTKRWATPAPPHQAYPLSQQDKDKYDRATTLTNLIASLKAAGEHEFAATKEEALKKMKLPDSSAKPLEDATTLNQGLLEIESKSLTAKAKHAADFANIAEAEAEQDDTFQKRLELWKTQYDSKIALATAAREEGKRRW